MNFQEKLLRGQQISERQKHSKTEARREGVKPDPAKRVPDRSPDTCVLCHGHCSCCHCHRPRLAALPWSNAKGAGGAIRSLRKKVGHNLPTSLALTLPCCVQNKNLRFTALSQKRESYKQISEQPHIYTQ